MKKAFKKGLSCIMSGLLVLTLLFVPGYKAAAAENVHLRVEGPQKTLYSGNVALSHGESLYTLLTGTLDSQKIEYMGTPDYLTEIGGVKAGVYGGYDGWMDYVNGTMPSVGMGEVKPSNGDDIVVYYGGDSTVYPIVKVTPQNPVQGQRTTINVTATSTDWNTGKITTGPVSGATVIFNGTSYTTDSAGNVTITMPQTAGTYNYSVSEDRSDNYPLIVRTGDVPLVVSADASNSTGGNSTSGSGTGAQTTSQRPVDSIAVPGGTIDKAISSAADYLQNNGAYDWAATLALVSAGHSAPQAFLTYTAQDLAQGETNTTTIAGLALGLRAANADPQNFNGFNLISEIYSAPKMDRTGLNGYVYGLLALDSGNYSIPSGEPNTRDSIVSGILGYQTSDGSFSLAKGSAGDSDMTAAAISALAPYVKSRTDVSTAVDKAVSRLSAMQQSDGGFLPFGSQDEAAESDAQVVIALSSVGIDPFTDSRFIKGGNSVLQNLLSFKQSDGGFEHTRNLASSDVMATEQSLLALESYSQYEKNGSGSIYNLTSSKPTITSVAVTKDNPDTGDTGVAYILLVTVASALCLIALRKKDKIIK